jgi:type I restriction enzyme M protein
VYDKTGEVECLEIARLLDYDDFRYTTVATRRPLRHWFESITEKYRALCNTEGFDANAKKNVILKTVASIDDIDARRSDSEFFAYLKKNNVKFTAADIKALRSAFAVVSEDAPEVHEKPLDPTSDLVADTALNDTEKIPQKQDADDYFAREVLPFAPDAWMDRSKDKLGVEFPFTRLFYKYRPLRTADDILAELNSLDDSITL